MLSLILIPWTVVEVGVVSVWFVPAEVPVLARYVDEGVLLGTHLHRAATD